MPTRTTLSLFALSAFLLLLPALAGADALVSGSASYTYDGCQDGGSWATAEFLTASGNTLTITGSAWGVSLSGCSGNFGTGLGALSLSFWNTYHSDYVQEVLVYQYLSPPALSEGTLVASFLWRAFVCFDGIDTQSTFHEYCNSGLSGERFTGIGTATFDLVRVPNSFPEYPFFYAQHAEWEFLVTPEPGTLLLVGLGLAAAARRAIASRRRPWC